MNSSEIIEMLWHIITELDARDCSQNSVVADCMEYSWIELCDKGSALFQLLKGDTNENTDCN